MDRQGDAQVTLIIVDLDQFVPRNHLLRRIKQKVNLEFVYDKVKDLYKSGGRPSYDPVVLLRMWLIGYLYNVTSERQLEDEVNMNLAYRWFLGIPLDQRVPDHSTLSENRNGRLKGSTLFTDVFEAIVDQCKAAGLVEGNAVVTDSTHVKANAGSDRREVVTVTKTPREYMVKLEEEARALNQAKQEERGGKKRGRRATEEPKQKTEVRSLTDKDAGLMGRPGKPHGFHFLAHMAVNPTHGVILSVMTTPGNVNDHEACVECIAGAKERHPDITEAAADAGYDVTEVHKGLSELGIASYTPIAERKAGSNTGHFTGEKFSYEPDSDTYRCPAGCALRFTHVQKDKHLKIYAARTADCKACPLKDKCIPQSKRFRTLKRPLFYEFTEQAHSRVGTPRYEQLQKLRRVWSEGTFALLKARHCLRRAIQRGLDSVTTQFLMASTAVNIKRLVAATR